jgi:hypothetical protein
MAPCHHIFPFDVEETGFVLLGKGISYSNLGLSLNFLSTMYVIKLISCLGEVLDAAIILKV